MTEQHAGLQTPQPWQLEAFIDGMDLPNVAAYFEQNPHERARVEAEMLFDTDISEVCYRFDCPPPEQLHAYLWDEFANLQKETFVQHVQLCPHCSQEIAELRAFINLDVEPIAPKTDVAPMPLSEQIVDQLHEMLDQARTIIATLVTPPASPLSPMAVRSDPALDAETRRTLLFETEDGDFTLTILKVDDDAWEISGQLFTMRDVATGTAKLIPQGVDSHAVESVISRAGVFDLPPIQTGRYQLRLELEETKLIVPDISVG